MQRLFPMRIPAAIQADLRRLRARFPKAKATFQIGLFHRLVESFLLDREAVVGLRDAWEAAGYPAQYEAAVYDPAVVEECRRNLGKSLRKLQEEGGTRNLWTVEKVRGEGYRVRVLDLERGQVLVRGWTFAPYDRALRESQHLIEIVEGPGYSLHPGVGLWSAGLLVGTAVLAGWALSLVGPPSERVAVQPGAKIASVACSSSLWAQGGGEFPEHAWTRCKFAADGQIGGQDAWVAYAEGDPGDYAEWVAVTLAEETLVEAIALHFPHWPCTRPDTTEVLCEPTGQPPRLVVERSADGVVWEPWLEETPFPPTAPWEPLVISLEPAATRFLRITGRQRWEDGDDLQLFIYFQVAEIIVNPPTA
ncbi:hypothetical protein IIA16_02965 [bacterium]|nr:hypothetical protein [bacterium]